MPHSQNIFFLITDPFLQVFTAQLLPPTVPPHHPHSFLSVTSLVFLEVRIP